ncbi:unnamed protein product [Calypogeia fissa]
MRREIQEAILTRSKRKRILKEGPNTMLGNLFEEEEGEEANIFVVEATKAKATDVEAEDTIEGFHDARLCSAFRTDKHRLEGYWARACSKCEVEILGMGDTMKALIDSGSEVNLMSREVYEEGGWMIDRDIDWKVNSMNSTRNPLFGACPNVKVKFGNVVEPQNIFDKEALPYLVILGQPFITELRMETKVLDDGTHMARIRSRDGLRIVQFPTVLPNHGRNQRDLRSKPEGKDWSSGNGSVLC